MRTILLIIILSTAAAAASRADYILLTHPQQCLILNKYEQTLSRPLPVGAPLRLVQPQLLLSDSLTSAAKVEFNGQIYYLLSGQEFQQSIQRALVLNDTVTLRVKQKHWQPLLAFSKAPLLSQSSLITRYFKTKRGTYVFSNGFGWARLTKKEVKPLARSAITSRTLPPALLARIRARVASANQSLQELTSYFNTKFPQERTAPQWQTSSEANRLRITFQQPAAASFFQRSAAVLKDEINQILLGSPFNCTATGDTLIVKRNRS